jgi:ribosome-associated protein
MIRVTETILLDESEFQERFIRSSGPGGQNVNKTRWVFAQGYSKLMCSSII